MSKEQTEQASTPKHTELELSLAKAIMEIQTENDVKDVMLVCLKSISFLLTQHTEDGTLEWDNNAHKVKIEPITEGEDV